MKGGCVVTELDVATTPDERGPGAIVGGTVTERMENMVILERHYQIGKIPQRVQIKLILI